ncbi:hypothetical protein C0J52_08831 [Blattella germanica]|nr:hypothetical protein C0J52_08831 [Blattella germanica]
MRCLEQGASVASQTKPIYQCYQHKVIYSVCTRPQENVVYLYLLCKAALVYQKFINGPLQVLCMNALKSGLSTKEYVQVYREWI